MLSSKLNSLKLAAPPPLVLTLLGGWSLPPLVGHLAARVVTTVKPDASYRSPGAQSETQHAVVRDSAGAAGELEALAMELRGAVGQFKTA